MAMKKIIPLLLLWVFFSVQMFQLCDESSDACQALCNNLRSISQGQFKFTVPTPVDDPDASLPLIVGQTLGHGIVGINNSVGIHPLASASRNLVPAVISHYLIQ